MTDQAKNKESEYKLSLLISTCETYQRHLEMAINRLVHDMPKDVVETYQVNNKLNIPALVHQMGTGFNLYQHGNVSDKYRWEEQHSSEKHPELTTALKKYRIVDNMRKQLTDEKTADPGQRIENMTKVLTPKNQEILKSRRDSSSGMKFLEKVFNILTLGVYSKISKGTFAFWKSHGEAFAQKVSDSSEEKTPSPKGK